MLFNPTAKEDVFYPICEWIEDIDAGLDVANEEEVQQKLAAHEEELRGYPDEYIQEDDEDRAPDRGEGLDISI